MKRLTLLPFFVFCVIVQGLPALQNMSFEVRAQTEADLIQTEEATASSTVFRQQRYLEKRAALKKLYSQQVEKYRLLENDYIIAKNQYWQLQTLSSLETAVQASREVMIVRTQVLQTYTELVQLTLSEAPGINLDRKEELVNKLTNSLQKLSAHLEVLETSGDRLAIAQRADEFDEINLDLTSNLYEALSVLAVSKLQTVYDQSILIHQDIQAEQMNASASALVTSQRERASQEIERQLGDAKLELDDIYQATLLREERDFASRSTYNNTLKDLDGVYVDLTQVVDYLAELLRL